MATREDTLEQEMHAIMEALGLVPNFSDWYAYGDELI